MEHKETVKQLSRDEYRKFIEFFDDIYKEHYQEHKGLIHLHHKSGLMINDSCYHGYKLPDNNNSKDLKALSVNPIRDVSSSLAILLIFFPKPLTAVGKT